MKYRTIYLLSWWLHNLKQDVHPLRSLGKLLSKYEMRIFQQQNYVFCVQESPIFQSIWICPYILTNCSISDFEFNYCTTYLGAICYQTTMYMYAPWKNYLRFYMGYTQNHPLWGPLLRPHIHAGITHMPPNQPMKYCMYAVKQWLYAHCNN